MTFHCLNKLVQWLKSFAFFQSLEQFFLTVGSDNFGNKIPLAADTSWSYMTRSLLTLVHNVWDSSYSVVDFFFVQRVGASVANCSLWLAFTNRAEVFALATLIKTFTKNWDSKCHLLELWKFYYERIYNLGRSLKIGQESSNRWCLHVPIFREGFGTAYF